VTRILSFLGHLLLESVAHRNFDAGGANESLGISLSLLSLSLLSLSLSLSLLVAPGYSMGRAEDLLSTAPTAMVDGLSSVILGGTPNLNLQP
jgi:hypothetical protein